MSNILMYISDYAIPIIIFYIVISGLFIKTEIFDDFIKGGKEGIKIVVDLVPTLIGLMVAIGVMRISGVFDIIVNFLRPMAEKLNFPSQLLPLAIIKMFSSSAATSLLIDIYKEFGTDSYIGKLASVMMSASETVFYTLAVYTAAGKIKKTRYIVLGGIFTTLIGIISSVWLLGM